MSIGVFSVSLTVKDLAASKAFYQTLGFSEVGGEESQNWLILSDGACTIGLFCGMFEKNTLTFNPGWGPGATPLDKFEGCARHTEAAAGGGAEFCERGGRRRQWSGEFYCY